MRKYAAAAALLLMSCNQADKPPAIAIDGAWARATLPAQTSSAAYFTIGNKGGADVLLSISSPAGDASIHSTSIDKGVMRMRAVPNAEVPADGKLELKPGGLHVMVMGLKQPLVAGSSIPLDLKFQKSGDVHVDAEVMAAGSEGAGM
jgi:copper(I)-binding protein